MVTEEKRMPKKKGDKMEATEAVKEVKEDAVLDILSSKQEVADELKMSLHQLTQLLRKYPFEGSGVPGKIMGRWKVDRTDVHRWFRYVQRQELRHPDARRMRPEEPPEIAAIKGR